MCVVFKFAKKKKKDNKKGEKKGACNGTLCQEPASLSVSISELNHETVTGKMLHHIISLQYYSKNAAKTVWLYTEAKGDVCSLITVNKWLS